MLDFLHRLSFTTANAMSYMDDLNDSDFDELFEIISPARPSKKRSCSPDSHSVVKRIRTRGSSSRSMAKSKGPERDWKKGHVFFDPRLAERSARGTNDAQHAATVAFQRWFDDGLADAQFNLRLVDPLYLTLPARKRLYELWKTPRPRRRAVFGPVTKDHYVVTGPQRFQSVEGQMERAERMLRDKNGEVRDWLIVDDEDIYKYRKVVSVMGLRVAVDEDLLEKYRGDFLEDIL